jgi:peptidoglycan/LPS O-acetylase OafA/YrhL
MSPLSPHPALVSPRTPSSSAAPTTNRQAPAERDRGRLPCLDGLRAISIALVLTAHLLTSETLPLLNPLWHFDLGNLGVRVFFVLSGFLITTLLLEEHAASGTINLRRFYFRRTFRIMPAYYTFLAVMALAAALGLVAISPAEGLRAAAYVSDYLHVPEVLCHTWSLSVEEQFYLLWPGVLLLLGLRRGFLAAAAVLLLSPGMRALAMHLHPRQVGALFAFDCVADALATGCLLAHLRGRLWAWAPYRRFLASPLVALLPAGLLAVCWENVAHPAFGALVGVSLLNLGTAVIVDWCLRFPSGRVGRVLNWGPVAFVGTASYSLYLWQQPFLLRHSLIPCPLNLLGLTAAALFSYRLVEQPALRLRSRLERLLFARRAPDGPAVSQQPAAEGAGEVRRPKRRGRTVARRCRSEDSRAEPRPGKSSLTRQ